MTTELNVLLITTDQFRGDCLSLLGHPLVRTPHLDRLGREGLVFTRHYSCSAPCGPARTTLLTGLYPCNHRSVTNGTPLDRRHTNLALEVRRAGYAPVLFGYTDTSTDPRGLPLDDPRLLSYEGLMDGFEVALGYQDQVPEGWINHLRGHGYEVPRVPCQAYLPAGYDPAAAREFPLQPALYRAEHSDSAWISDRIIDYLQAHGGETWFLHAVYLRPHPPLVAPAPYHTLYDPVRMPCPPRGSDRGTDLAHHPYLAHWFEIDENTSHQAMGLDLATLRDSDRRRMQAIYYGLVSEVDAQIGRVLDHLRGTGELDRTLVVFTSDHGELLGDHWLWGKGGFYDGSYHVPLIIRDPRHLDAPRILTQHFSESVDLMPTLLERVGLEVPETCDGRSLWPLIEGPAPRQWRAQTFWEFDFRSVDSDKSETALDLRPDQCSLNVIRDRRYKYVHFTALPPLLFDLEADPLELHDVAAQPRYLGVLSEYAGKLLSQRMLHADRTLTNYRLTPRGLKHYHGPRS